MSHVLSHVLSHASCLTCMMYLDDILKDEMILFLFVKYHVCIMYMSFFMIDPGFSQPENLLKFNLTIFDTELKLKFSKF